MFQKDLLKGYRILVTGGGTGLGKAMSKKFLELGAELFICGRRGIVLEAACQELEEKTGGKISPFVCDIRVPQAIDEMLEEIWLSGPLNGLVNNAAGNFISKSEDLSPRGFDAISNIVMSGTFYVTRACGARWIANGDNASIISILANYIWTGSAYLTPSAMAKAGVSAMTQSLAVEWGGRGIRLNAIAPGPFPTKGAWDRLMPNANLSDKYTRTVPMGRTGEHSELANLATFLLSDECKFLNGAIIPVDGGQWLNGGGTFSWLEDLNDDDWKTIRAQIKQSNDKDKTERS